uniref:Spindle and kinetochore associated complex subunit 3 n=1 Tax=Propithecus coquereli TaxID=379532 RepID=A0A2K6FMJ2_PROCO
MDPIRSFCGKLRCLASTLDCETARLQRALDREESDFEDCPVRILHDLHSEVQTLKDDVNILLDKARLESQESIGFIKATKILMEKNSMDIIKIREVFQKYGYNPRVKKNSVCEQEVIDSTPELSECEIFQKPDVKDDLCDPTVACNSVSEKSPRSPQLSDFGLERYMVSQVLPKPTHAVNDRKEEPKIITPATSQSPAKVLKTPKCALKMDDFECVTPKLEHFGISEYTMCLNEDYTMGLKNVKNKKRHELTKEETRSHLYFHDHRMCLLDAEYANSPLAPTFCTPGLKIPSTKNSTALVTFCKIKNSNLAPNNSDTTTNSIDNQYCIKYIHPLQKLNNMR